MKKVFALLAALMLVFAACGDSDDSGSNGGDGGGGDVASVGDCDDLVDEAMDMLQDVLDELSALSLEDITALGESGDEPEALQDLTERGDALQARADELDCSDEEMGAAVIARVDELEASGPFAELILEGLRSDPEIFGN